MTKYIVQWAISIEAENPKEAAEKAMELQRASKPLATLFAVQTHDGSGRWFINPLGVSDDRAYN